MTTITLITPVFNSAATIADNLRCVTRQTTPCQHILVDGASTDGTLEVIEKEKRAGELLVSEPDRGMYDAINKGLEKAEGEIVGILNADDYYPRDDVLAQVATVFENPDIEACYGNLLYVDPVDTAKVIRNWKSGAYERKRFYNGWMPPHPTFFVRKRLYDQHGGYRLDLGSAADYEMMLRLLFKHEARAAYIPQVLVHMRNEGMSNASVKNRLRANRFDRKAWRVNKIRPRPWTLTAKPLRKILQWV